MSSSTTITTSTLGNEKVELVVAVYNPDNDPKHKPPPIKDPWGYWIPFSAEVLFFDLGRHFLDTSAVLRSASVPAVLEKLKMKYKETKITYVWWKWFDFFHSLVLTNAWYRPSVMSSAINFVDQNKSLVV